MTRHDFLKLLTLLAGGAIMPLYSKHSPSFAPALFVGHGSPMNVLADNPFTRSLHNLGTSMTTPEAILIISAHWMPPFLGMSVHETPELMYDFFGFPPPLYEVTYPAPAASFLVPKIQALQPHSIVKNRPLDHGTWTVLKHLFPKADIPVMQFGIPKHFTLREHYELGLSLRMLRSHGVMILGSGNITHNLSIVDPNPVAAVAPWAHAFDHYIKKAILTRDINALIEMPDRAPHASTAHPTLEHYIPLLYVAGAMFDEDESTFPFEGFDHGTLSMRSWLLQ